MQLSMFAHRPRDAANQHPATPFTERFFGSRTDTAECTEKESAARYLYSQKLLPKSIFVSTLNIFEFSFDPAKSERNRRERNLPFERARDFDFAAASFYADERFDYPEPRFIGIGYLDDATVVAFCLKLVQREIERYQEWVAAKTKGSGKVVDV